MNRNPTRQGSTEPAPKEAEPWHPADRDHPAAQRGVPTGTHSLTGGGADVGMPVPPESGKKPERAKARSESEGPDPLAEPRTNLGEILGRKP